MKQQELPLPNPLVSNRVVLGGLLGVGPGTMPSATDVTALLTDCTVGCLWFWMEPPQAIKTKNLPACGTNMPGP